MIDWCRVNLQEINQVYNQTNGDMSRDEFVKEMQRMTSPAEAQKDLGKIVAGKQTAAITAAREKQRIDRAIENAR